MLGVETLTFSKAVKFLLVSWYPENWVETFWNGLRWPCELSLEFQLPGVQAQQTLMDDDIDIWWLMILSIQIENWAKDTWSWTMLNLFWKPSQPVRFIFSYLLTAFVPAGNTRGMQYAWSSVKQSLVDWAMTWHHNILFRLLHRRCMIQIDTNSTICTINITRTQLYIIPEKVGDESQPPNSCSVAKSTRRRTFGCFLYTRATACITSRTGFVVPTTLPEAELNIHVETARLWVAYGRGLGSWIAEGTPAA